MINMHEDTPAVSYSTVSIANDSGTFVIQSTELVRLHGEEMIHISCRWNLRWFFLQKTGF